ncbi:hypothetical protein DelCs14_1731 [Delftia sp. Cs1-4]|uniref:hypothetical protein n=1 Tax=Delftia sp. (strain Cs1-4) TaxID=742013 RepID=UPI00020E7AEA|nr:hypothetical protein [Delftia sp. Cs1-4]AEF88760.1 hypothetical protein DelCs14_1731 [Delftia sp. Cs1-4]
MSFRMQPALLPDVGEPFEPLCFTTLRRGPDGAVRPFNPVLASTVGAYLEYGNLFAYLFRRFGYPNQARDVHTELARYTLTTPRPDLFLNVIPRVDGRTDLCLEFLAPASVGRAAQAYLLAAIDAWEGRALAHQAGREMPRWLQARAEALAGRPSARGRRAGDASISLRQALRTVSAATGPDARRAREFLQRCLDRYARVEARPQPLERPAMLEDWLPADPLQPYAVAAGQALANLMREVGLGGDAIDVFGSKPKGSRMLAPARPAGEAVGALMHLDGQRLSELHRLITGLGRGNARRGLARAISLLAGEGAR